MSSKLYYELECRQIYLYFSFTDLEFKNVKETSSNAVVLITNPLDAKFLYGSDIEETLEMMQNSTHLRVLGMSFCVISISYRIALCHNDIVSKL